MLAHPHWSALLFGLLISYPAVGYYFRATVPRLLASTKSWPVRELSPQKRNLLNMFGGEDWMAASLLHRCFGGQTLNYFATLRAPELISNVFFRPVAPTILAAVDDESTSSLIGLAQLLRVRLREAAGEGPESAKRPVAFMQSVAVDESARRQGVARQLVKWCEERAAAQWVGDETIDEVWLAVDETNRAALALYESLGYKRRRVTMGNILMVKQISTSINEASVDDGIVG